LWGIDRIHYIIGRLWGIDRIHYIIGMSGVRFAAFDEVVGITRRSGASTLE
jgi:hypothetical protein